MTPDERNLLTRFLADLGQTRGVQKDSEAASLISQSMVANPDAPYLLVQHAILADQALASAQARIVELEDQVRGRSEPQEAPGQGGGFLSGAFGQGQRRPQPGPQSEPQAGPQPGPWGGGRRPDMVVPQSEPYGGGSGFFGGGAPMQPGGMGSFLRNAGTAAAGVAGGAFLFQGLSNLFGGNHGGGGFLGGGGFGGGYDQPVENITNNFYDAPNEGYDRGGGRQSFLGGDSGRDDVSYDSDNGDSGGDDYS